MQNGRLERVETVDVDCIQLRGVSVHNLRHVDLDLPRGQLLVFCGVSGSGKTSLAVDTLYAEGQRRYIESFSAYTRQFLDRLEKPEAERIDGLPPAVAVTRRQVARSNRTTVGTASELVDYLRLLFARVGRVVCRECKVPVRRHSPDSAAQSLAALQEGQRFLVAFPIGDPASDGGWDRWVEDGFQRGVVDSRLVELGRPNADSPPLEYVVVDRLTAGRVPESRLRDSLETAFDKGQGTVVVWIDGDWIEQEGVAAATVALDGREWTEVRFRHDLVCSRCGTEYPEPEARLFSFNSPLGACPECEGFGNVMDLDLDLVIPDPRKTLRRGAIAPWTTKAYTQEQERLLEEAVDHGLPVDVPYRELSEQHRDWLLTGIPNSGFDGIEGFFERLQRGKYKMHVRVFLSRWRSQRPCPLCEGDRLRPEALATEVGGRNIAEVCRLQIDAAREFFSDLALDADQATTVRFVLEQIQARLRYLASVGLGYLALDRPLHTLSGGESQRVMLTSALGSNLVNMLYVLDEPSIGLHPRDVARLLDSVCQLRDRGNSVVVVEHEEAVLRAADEVVEFGPEAGRNGGRIVFTGSAEEMEEDEDSLTGAYLSGRRGGALPGERREPTRGKICLTGARGHNLQSIRVEFPLGVLCLVTGVSGAGKSTLIQDTLYPALCRRKRKESPKPAPHDDVVGDGQIDDVILVDQAPIARSPRSNPVTYIKAFDQIRSVFADTIEARTHNYSAGHFSFNVDGGRCSTCTGEGYIEIDMQFLADIYMKCPDCGGKRYRPEILEVTYRGLNIAEVLELTVREAFSFFRGQPKVQARLKQLIDVGLEYLRLGQPANTLSAGEAQRLKLAAYLATATRKRTLFLLDEPTTGLHFSDIVQLLDCFDALLAAGHSLIVVEHNLQLMRAADYIIDLGPGAAEHGGRLVVAGSPEEVADCRESITGSYLRDALKQPAPAEGEGAA